MSDPSPRERASWARGSRCRPRMMPRLLADLRKIRRTGILGAITEAPVTPAPSAESGPLATPAGLVRALGSLGSPAGLVIDGGDQPRLPSGGLILVSNNPISGAARLVLARLPWQRRVRTRMLGGGDQAKLVDWLCSGGVVLAFPDGPPSGDGILGEFGAAAARLAARAGVPVVPVGIRGALGVPATRRSRARVGVRFGSPLGEHAGPAEQRSAVAALLAEDAQTWWQVQRRSESGVIDTAPRSGWRQTWAETAPTRGDGVGSTPTIWR